MDWTKVKNEAWDYFMITVGTMIFLSAWVCFMIPNELTAGGLTGACAIIQYTTGIPASYSNLVLNGILLIIASIILGKSFGVKTIYVIVLSSVLLEAGSKIEWLHAVPGNFLYIKDTIMIPIIGGLLEALGISTIIKHGGSTGGTDILALIINKFWPISPGKVYLVTDFFIITSLLFLPGKTLQEMLYGYIMMYTYSLVIDPLLLGKKNAVQVLVFSEKYNEIADFIMHKMERGVTALNAVGWYTQSEKKVLLVLIRKSEMPDLNKAVKEIDPKAFVSICPASGVYGEGFEEIKTGVERKKKKELDAKEYTNV